ncbi:MAG: aminotransferase class III-fold pyridoxal phosphate-dependent enzyme, partial [Chitinophagia bacterium]|nr:aminotransferase class III-fold pyridoxal phosphate-dependent enzyme [Chitinophagia bacterium]
AKASNSAAVAKSVQSACAKALPAFMVPQLLVSLPELPFFPNGKVDKRALPNPDASALLDNSYQKPTGATEQLLSDIWKEVLGVSRAGAVDNFFELGGSSLLAQKTVALLRDRHNLNVPVVKLYQFPTIAQLAAFIDGKTATRRAKPMKQAAGGEVAVIGMQCRFPGAANVEAFWDNLINGRETTTFFREDELHPSLPASLIQNPDYVKARGIITGAGEFDAAFFGIPPRQAEVMDPQQRVFLEVAWEALERSGYPPGQYDGTAGVFAGVRFNTYYANNVLPNPQLIDNVGSFQAITLNDKDYVATRAAYALNLKGPAVNVQSACSTTLVAIAEAVNAIRSGQCDMAIAGGATINAPVNVGHLYNEGAILSRDGHCKPFDADATGTVFSDGVGVVVLRNLEAAKAAGDNIIAVIKGIGLNNDGGSKGSFTAPSAEGQAAAIEMAMEDAGISPAEIGYIEAHGTATPLGDPIEIEGLTMAFAGQAKPGTCAIGSVKSNFGHLTTTAGVAGFMKACLALQHGVLPASIHFNTPNPHIDFKNSPFYVQGETAPWTATQQRIAGVSSFGVGGTNAHVILSEYTTEPVKDRPSRPYQLLCWSAKSEASVLGYEDKLIQWFHKNPEAPMGDVAFTLATARQEMDYRRFTVANSSGEFLLQKEQVAGSIHGKHCQNKPGPLVFLFPGQGDQYVGMCRSLYDNEHVFRQAVDECARLLQPHMGADIREVIYPAQPDAAATNRLNDTTYSQPALFTIGYALGRLWMSWGIYPAAFAGHSIGEFVAACFAGVFTLADALKLIAARGRMMGALPRGSMLSVRLSSEQVQPYLSNEIALAAANSPQLSVLAGTDSAIEGVEQQLTATGVLHRRLATSHAFHSHMMDAVVAPFEALVKQVSLQAPQIPTVSTVTGNWLSADEATNPSYWAGHLRATVQFGKAIQTLLDNQYQLFLEAGPGRSATTLARQQSAGTATVAIATMEKDEASQPSSKSALIALGQLWLQGITPAWKQFYAGENRRKLPELPTYAFNKQTFWVEAPAPAASYSLPLLNNPITEQPTDEGDVTSLNTTMDRIPQLIARLKVALEDASGIEMSNAAPDASFIELGLDSLLLTQIAINLKKDFGVTVTFRQLNEDLGSLDLLARHMDSLLPAEPAQPRVAIPVAAQHVAQTAPAWVAPTAMGGLPVNASALDLINFQLQQLAAQVAMLQGAAAPAVPLPVTVPAPTTVATTATAIKGLPELTAEEAAEIKKPFGAAARIEKQSAALSGPQQQYLAQLIERYNAKTAGSKAYTQRHRDYMADPRVVSGFRPATKELVYSLVIKQSKGCRLWDIDGNEYIDALNGFGSSMLGYQPDFLKKALIEQIERGYEIGPQHELAGDVCRMICEFTGFDRAGLCNTGSEAVLGAMRIARTVTGRSLIVSFAGSYHGITDEAGIMPEAVQNMLILDYGTDETLEIIRSRAHELAAVLVEPVQSRRCDFQPVDFLKQVREITLASGTLLIFDEVISGFRFHPGGVQAIFGIRADLGTYGKVVGGGLSIGVIAGKRPYMDALDGGWWQFGDDSIPEVGVTYFAGTFVRHPLALATAKASLEYFKEQGPQLQEGLNARGKYVATTLNRILVKHKVPMFVAQFGSLWRIRFLSEYPYMELFFVLMRLKGIHMQEGFPCFLTTAHTDRDIETIITTFEEALVELKAAGLIPEYEHEQTTVANDVNV